jgi:hypothetical protein
MLATVDLAHGQGEADQGGELRFALASPRRRGMTCAGDMIHQPRADP